MAAQADIWNAFKESMGDRFIFGAPLQKLTTFGIGGRADVLACPETTEELASLLKTSQALKMPYLVLGGGSNLLFSENFEGLIIKLGNGFKGIESLGGGILKAGAAAPSAGLLHKAIELNLSGLESLAGIPGTVGGALCMNAGSGGGSIGQSLSRLFGLDRQGAFFSLKAEELDLSYRRLGGLSDGAVITGGEFKLEQKQPGEIKSQVAEMLRRRSGSQPKGKGSAGCIFKNPPGNSAGRLIDECGFKGMREGGAEVSQVHANFIVNSGGASARDIIILMNSIRDAVLKKKGIALEPEIKIVGRDGLIQVYEK